MKKMLLALILLSFFFAGAVRADASSGQVCGNVYQVAYGDITYLMKFAGDDTCTTGTATLKWASQSRLLPFTVDENHIIDVDQIGHMALDGDRLIMLDSASIILDIYPFSPVPAWVKH
jgi:hypothetical protein